MGWLGGGSKPLTPALTIWVLKIVLWPPHVYRGACTHTHAHTHVNKKDFCLKDCPLRDVGQWQSTCQAWAQPEDPPQHCRKMAARRGKLPHGYWLELICKFINVLRWIEIRSCLVLHVRMIHCNTFYDRGFISVGISVCVCHSLLTFIFKTLFFSWFWFYGHEGLAYTFVCAPGVRCPQTPEADMRSSNTRITDRVESSHVGSGNQTWIHLKGTQHS